MNSEWLEIDDSEIDVQSIMEKIQRKLEQTSKTEDVDVQQTADLLWSEIIGFSKGPLQTNRLPIRPQDCDIAPTNYKIEWRIPVIGQIHAVVRRIIDNEIRMFLFPSIHKQVRYNRRVLWVLRSLVEENLRLRSDLEELQDKFDELQDQT